MYNTILVPLDGSKRAEAIIPHVENLARHDQAKVIFAHVVEPVSRVYTLPYKNKPIFEFAPKEAKKSKSYLTRWQKKFEHQGCEADVILLRGLAVEGILLAANETRADLIAMTGKGSTGLSQVFYGSVTAGVLHRVRRPLLLVRGKTREATETNQRILVPLDGSKRAEAILPHVIGVAQLYQAEVTLLRVIQTQGKMAVFEDVDDTFEKKEVSGQLQKKLKPKKEVKRVKEARKYLLKCQKILGKEGLKTEATLVHGRPVDSIIHVAKSIEADLIALASQGNTGLSQVFYGSVAAGILNRAQRPLLVIRPE